MPCDCQLILEASPRYLSMVCTSSRLSSVYFPDLHTGPGTHESKLCDMRGSQPPRQKAPTPQSPYTANLLAPTPMRWNFATRTRAAGRVLRTVAILCAFCSGKRCAYQYCRRKGGGQQTSYHDVGPFAGSSMSCKHLIVGKWSSAAIKMMVSRPLL